MHRLGELGIARSFTGMNVSTLGKLENSDSTSRKVSAPLAVIMFSASFSLALRPYVRKRLTVSRTHTSGTGDNMNHESAVQFDTESRIHMALVVRNLEGSIAFYRTLFGH